MRKQKINEAQYVELINEKMKKHELFQDEMLLTLTPKYSSKPSGIRFESIYNIEVVVAWAESEVNKKYLLCVTQ